MAALTSDDQLTIPYFEAVAINWFWLCRVRHWTLLTHSLLAPPSPVIWALPPFSPLWPVL